MQNDSTTAQTMLSNKLRHAIELHQTGQFAEAGTVYEEILALEPRHSDAVNLLGAIAIQTRNPQRAVELYERALEIDSKNLIACCNSGLALWELRQFDAALARYDQAIAIKPDVADVHFNRGNVLRDLKLLAAALTSYRRAIAIDPDYAEAHLACGDVLRDLQQWDAARASYDQAICLVPDYEEAYFNRGNVLHELKQWDAALASYDQAIALKADSPAAYCNRGVVLQELRQWDAALASYDQAIALKTDFATAYGNRGVILQALKRWDAAMASYAHALALEPDYPFLYGTWLHTKMHLCDWQGLESAHARLVSKIEQAEKAAMPFPVLALADSAPLQRGAAEVFVKAMCPASLALPPIDRRGHAGQIRLGYFSADMHRSAMTHLMAKLFEKHNRQRFHMVAFSFGPDMQDPVRRRLSETFAEFIDVRAKTPREIAQLSRDLQIDIAVDLMGHTRNGRVQIFSHRAAPIQVSYLGYPGTIGAPYIDYILADRVVIADVHRRHYAERVIYLPNSYFPTSYQIEDLAGQLPDPKSARTELGLPPYGFVFCCFNNRYKITPSVFDIWMRLLRQVEGSVLWLLADSEIGTRNLRKEARARGVSEARLIFAPRTSAAQHLVRHRAADLFLDTRPYNAHTSGSDALWAGVPVLTQVGESFAARVAASLLTAVGLPELITTTAEQYEATALHLATDPDRLARIKDRLNGYRSTAPLFDSDLQTRHLEQAYLQMYERYQQGLAPEDIDLKSVQGVAP
jgi:predicted O-linked N-acetylglucosamine transferase (SPINDLY family)